MPQLNEKQTLRDLRADLHREILVVCSKYGFRSELGNIRYELDGSECRVSVTVRPNNPQPLNNLKPGMPQVGDKFRWRGQIYTYTGYNKRRWKMPHSVTRSDGKMFKWGQPIIDLAVKV